MTRSWVEVVRFGCSFGWGRGDGYGLVLDFIILVVFFKFWIIVK